MMLAQTRLLVPKTLPIKRPAASSAPRVVMPEMKTVKRRYFFMVFPVRRCADYTNRSAGEFAAERKNSLSCGGVFSLHLHAGQVSSKHLYLIVPEILTALARGAKVPGK